MPKKNAARVDKKIKVPKVITMFCVICEKSIARDTFVAHVREHLSTGESQLL